jgi:hypothetical protein
MVQVEYDKKADALYIWVRKAKYDISEELAENVILDLDKKRAHNRHRSSRCIKKHRTRNSNKNPQHRKKSNNRIIFRVKAMAQQPQSKHNL